MGEQRGVIFAAIAALLCGLGIGFMAGQWRYKVVQLQCDRRMHHAERRIADVQQARHECLDALRACDSARLRR